MFFMCGLRPDVDCRLDISLEQYLDQTSVKSKVKTKIELNLAFSLREFQMLKIQPQGLSLV